MTQYVINIGALPNDGTGDPLRTAFNDVNLNFNQVWATGLIGSNIAIANNTILTTNTNGNLILNPNGIGQVQANAHVVPDQTRIRSLGSATRLWDTVYAYYGNIAVANIGTANIANISTITIGVANLHISGGSNGYVLQTDGTGNLTWTAQTGGGNGVPGGANTQVQFNDAGVFGGSSGFVFNRTTNALSTPGTFSAVGNITGSNIFGNIQAADGNTSVMFNQEGFLGADAGFSYDYGANTLYVETVNISGKNNHGDQAVYAGVTGFTPLGSNVVAQFAGNADSYTQVNFQNISSSPTASGDYIITANNGDDLNNFIDMGIAGNNWDGTQENSLGNAVGANDGYLYVNGANLVVGTVVVDGTHTWKFDTTGNLTAGGNIVPDASNTYSLGSSTNQWKDLWVSNTTIYMNSVPISLTAGNVLTVGGQDVVTTTANGVTNLGNIGFTGDAIYDLNGIIVENADLTHGATSALIIPANGSNAELQLNNLYGNIVLTAGLDIGNTVAWTFDNANTLTTPGNIIVGTGTTGIINWDANSIGVTADSVEDLTGLYLVKGDAAQLYANSNVEIYSNTSGSVNQWKFTTNGNLTLPQGSTISEGPSPNFSGSAVIITPAGTSDPNQQLQIYPTTIDGNHLHLTSGNLQVTDIFLGDDTQYIRTDTTGSMVVGTNSGAGAQGGNQWLFDASGNLTVPGTIKSTSPLEYRGFYASLNQISGDDPSINQIVLSQSVNITGSNLSSDTNNDDFTVVELGVSDVTAVINLYGASQVAPIPLTDVQSFARAYIDYVLYNGDTLHSTVGDMQAAFATNESLLIGSMPDGTLYANPRFNAIQTIFDTTGFTSSGEGSGAVFYYDFDDSPNGTLDYSSMDWNRVQVVVPGVGYQVNDTITVPGTEFGGASPDNDMTITVTSVDIDGGINGWTQAGSMSQATYENCLVQHYIYDGGNDIYDVGNFIGTSSSACEFVATSNADGELVVSAVTSGSLQPWQTFFEPVDSGWTVILWQKSGTPGGAGTYICGGNNNLQSDLPEATYTANGIDYSVNQTVTGSATWNGGDYGSMLSITKGIFSTVGLGNINGFGYLGETGSDGDGVKTLTSKFPLGTGVPLNLQAGGLNWTLNPNGETLFPVLSTQRGDNPGGTISGYTLRIGNGAQEAVITTPDGVTGNEYAQRLVINPGAGSNYGEGGDIYLWAGRGGDGSGSGGDIKIRGGQGGANTSAGTGGDGGYIRVEAGDSASVGGNPGYIDITGGQSSTGVGGYVRVTGGYGAGGGDANVTGGYAYSGSGGAVNIVGGGSNDGASFYGNVNIQTGGKTWTFDNTGELTFPSGGRVGSAGKGWMGVDNGLTGAPISITNFFGGNTDMYAACINSYNDGTTGTVTISTYANGAGQTGQWSFNGTGTTTLPTIATGESTGESVTISGTRDLVGGLSAATPYAASVPAGGTPTVVYTATSNEIQSVRLTFAVQRTGAGYLWEQFDVVSVRTNSGTDANFTVSNYVSSDPAADATVVSAQINGDTGQIEIVFTLNPAFGGFINYTATEFGLMVD